MPPEWVQTILLPSYFALNPIWETLANVTYLKWWTKVWVWRLPMQNAVTIIGVILNQLRHTDTVFACKSDKQCGQMARLLFPYLAITNIQICSVTEHFCQSRLRIFTSSKWTFIKNCQMFKFLPKWQNFFKSGHTAFESVLFFREHNTRVCF